MLAILLNGGDKNGGGVSIHGSADASESPANGVQKATLIGNGEVVMDWINCQDKEKQRQRVTLLKAPTVLNGISQHTIEHGLKVAEQRRATSMSVNLVGKPFRRWSSSK